jgi:hypothetical protein
MSPAPRVMVLKERERERGGWEHIRYAANIKTEL